MATPIATPIAVPAPSTGLYAALAGGFRVSWPTLLVLLAINTAIAVLLSLEDKRPFWHPFMSAQVFGLTIAYSGRRRQDGVAYPYFATPEDSDAFYNELVYLCVNQFGAFNFLPVVQVKFSQMARSKNANFKHSKNSFFKDKELYSSSR